jgi:hypothetical protein
MSKVRLVNGLKQGWAKVLTMTSDSTEFQEYLAKGSAAACTVSVGISIEGIEGVVDRCRSVNQLFDMFLFTEPNYLVLPTPIPIPIPESIHLYHY